MPLQRPKYKMIGRVYRLGSSYWRVLAAGEPFDRGPRRNVLLEQVVPLGNGGFNNEGWPAMVDGELGPLRVVDGFLYRATGFRTVRPFRGLRRVGR